MSSQTITSDLFIDLSTEEQQLLVGGKQTPEVLETPQPAQSGMGSSGSSGYSSGGSDKSGYGCGCRRFPIKLSGFLYT